MDGHGQGHSKDLGSGLSETVEPLDRSRTHHDETIRREDMEEEEEDDDLESHQSARDHYERDRDEGEDGDLTELAAPPPVSPTRTRHDSLEQEELQARRTQSYRTQTHSADPDDGDEFLTEFAAPPPIERRRTHHDEEKAEQDDSVPQSIESPDEQSSKDEEEEASAKPFPTSHLATQLYIHSYLIFFAILGTLARLGIEAITTYPNAVVTSPVLWANLAGSFFLGFLTEDRNLFREEWGSQSADEWSFHPSKLRPQGDEEEEGQDENAIQQVRAAHAKVKKTLPLFIGLAVGFCGSFTSFSSFMLDAFLAALNKLPESQPGSSTFGSTPTSTRHGGYSFEATLAVLIVHVAISLGALQVGANAALALDRVLPITLPFKFVRTYIDPLIALLGFGSWLGALWLSIWPPAPDWRGRVTFALVLAPPGCLLRFYASKHLNSRLPSFPLGTFAVNVLGTAVLGMCYDLQHSGAAAAAATRGVVGCQVLEGVIQGFCGCTTTVSTWVVELDTLRRRHAYVYGLASVSVAMGFLVAIMGSLEWTRGFAAPVC